MLSFINHKVGLLAIYEYLSPYYFQGYKFGNKDIGGFISSVTPIMDCTPADQALMADWQDVIDNADEIEVKDCFFKMIKFLEIQADMGWPEIGEFLRCEKLTSKSKEVEKKQLVRWLKAVEKASQYDIEY